MRKRTGDVLRAPLQEQEPSFTSALLFFLVFTLSFHAIEYAWNMNQARLIDRGERTICVYDQCHVLEYNR